MGQTESYMYPKTHYEPDYCSYPRNSYTKSASFASSPINRLQAEMKPKKASSFSSFTGDMVPRSKGSGESDRDDNQLEFAGPSSEPVSPKNRATVDTGSECDMHEMSADSIINNDGVDVKRNSDVRASYLHKVLQPASKRPPKCQTVMIFDWDDTLLCTSYLSQYEGRTLHPSTRQRLKDIEGVAKRILQLSMRLGHTYIITNAMEGWVEYSAAKYVPGLLPILRKVPIISARSRYECLYPGDVQKWKIHAFMDLQRQYDSHIITNLNSLGDSNYEMDATKIMGNEFSEALVKTIKFQENPSPEELFKQLELVAANFEKIAESAKNMKVSLERRPA